MRARRSTALVGLLVALTAACTTEERSAPVTDGPATAPASTQPPATTTTTTTPPTTVGTTTTSTTIAPTTTALAGPTEPAAVSAPVFAGGAGDPWLPLGGWNGRAFVGPTATDAPGWRTGEDVRLSTLSFNPSAVRLGPNGEACSGLDGPTLEVVLDPPRPPGFGPAAVAVGGDWRLRPRRVVEVDADVPAYDDAAAELLADEPADTAAGAIRQIVVADLDADGDTEALVVHADEREEQGQVTGYSILLAVDTATGAATEIDSSVAPFVEIPEPAAPSTDGASGSTAPTTTEPVDLPVLERQRVLDVLDLNGDGVMEVLVRVWSIERVGVDVYAVTGDRFRRVAGADCDR